MISFKEGVDCTNISDKTFVAILTAHRIMARLGVNELVVTSLRDGEHMAGSKHYEGEAFDLRIWAFNDIQARDYTAQLSVDLGDGYDVILHKTHIHVEYDPK